MNENINNQLYFNCVKKVWDAEPEEETGTTYPRKLTFIEQLTLPHVIDFITKKALGNNIGITVGLWISKTFTHTVLERRGLNNLFGLSHRKTTIVNDIPYWLQTTIAILVGYIALEIAHYFLKTKHFIAGWNKMQMKITPYMAKLKQRF